jgi:hypothetical protein
VVRAQSPCCAYIPLLCTYPLPSSCPPSRKDLVMRESIDISLINLDYGDLKPVEIPVTLPGGKRYILREASAGEIKTWRNAMQRSIKMTDGKITGATNMADNDVLLVGLCLHPCNADGEMLLDRDKNPLPTAPKTIEAMTYQIQKQLKLTIEKISRLEDDETEEQIEARMTADTLKLRKLRGGRNGKAEKGSEGEDESHPPSFDGDARGGDETGEAPTRHSGDSMGASRGRRIDGDKEQDEQDNSAGNLLAGTSETSD